MALPYGAVNWSEVCDCGISDHAHYLLYLPVTYFGFVLCIL